MAFQLQLGAQSKVWALPDTEDNNMHHVHARVTVVKNQPLHYLPERELC